MNDGFSLPNDFKKSSSGFIGFSGLPLLPPAGPFFASVCVKSRAIEHTKKQRRKEEREPLEKTRQVVPSQRLDKSDDDDVDNDVNDVEEEEASLKDEGKNRCQTRKGKKEKENDFNLK